METLSCDVLDLLTKLDQAFPGNIDRHLTILCLVKCLKIQKETDEPGGKSFDEYCMKYTDIEEQAEGVATVLRTYGWSEFKKKFRWKPQTKASWGFIFDCLWANDCLFAELTFLELEEFVEWDYGEDNDREYRLCQSLIDLLELE